MRRDDNEERVKSVWLEPCTPVVAGSHLLWLQYIGNNMTTVYWHRLAQVVRGWRYRNVWMFLVMLMTTMIRQSIVLFTWAPKWSGVTLCSVCSKESSPHSHSFCDQNYEFKNENLRWKILWKMRTKVTMRRMLSTMRRTLCVVDRALLLGLEHWAVYSSLVSLLVLLQPPLREHLPRKRMFSASVYNRRMLNIWYLQVSNCNDHHGSAEQGQVCHLIEHYASVKQGHNLWDTLCADDS